MTARRALAAALASLLLAIGTHGARAAPCVADDGERHVSGASQCLLMRRFGSVEPETMVVWLHGDVSAGGPADYHFAAAEQAAARLAERNVLSVALVRPGYPDGSGESSSVAVLDGGRADHYTLDNVGEVGAAIERLRARFKPKSVVAVGHSGGAATAAVLLGMKPGLIDGAILVACPCDLVAWRAGRRAWTRSENPIRWADRVPPSAKVVAITGARDDNTPPDLGRTYIDALKARGVDASFVVVPEQTHNGAFRSGEVGSALERLLPSK